MADESFKTPRCKCWETRGLVEIGTDKAPWMSLNGKLLNGPVRWICIRCNADYGEFGAEVRDADGTGDTRSGQEE